MWGVSGVHVVFYVYWNLPDKGPFPYPQRTHILRLLGPKTLL